MMLPLALGNSWIKDTPWGMLKFSKALFMTSILGICYSTLAIWISPPSEQIEPRQGEIEPKKDEHKANLERPLPHEIEERAGEIPKKNPPPSASDDKEPPRTNVPENKEAPKKNIEIPVKPMPRLDFQRPEVRQALAARFAGLSDDIEELAEERKNGENALPPIDPDVPEGKSNEPFMKREHYYQQTRGEFHFKRFDHRCMILIEALSDRKEIVDDVKGVETMCQTSRSVLELKRLSTYLATLAQKVQQLPN